MTTGSNTAKNSGKPFAKGDPRINRKGRPRSFDAARELAQAIASEPVTNANGEPALLNGHKLTRVELLLRAWAQSKDPRLQIAFFEVAYGKTPTQTEISGPDGSTLEVVIKYADVDADPTYTPHRARNGSA
jgi:hypothetical protein